MNDEGQLALGEEVGKHLLFFPSFMKKDFFSSKGYKVLDCCFGFSHVLVLCYDPLTLSNRVYGCGLSKYGELCYVNKKNVHDFFDLTDMIPEEVVQIACGSFHSMFLGKSGKLYGCGSNSEG